MKVAAESNVFSAPRLKLFFQFHRRRALAVPYRRSRRLRGNGRGPRRRRRPLAAVPGHHPRRRLATQSRQEASQCHQLLNVLCSW